MPAGERPPAQRFPRHTSPAPAGTVTNTLTNGSTARKQHVQSVTFAVMLEIDGEWVTLEEFLTLAGIPPSAVRGELWTTAEAAHFLGVSTNRIKQWVFRGLPRVCRKPVLLWSHDVIEWDESLAKSGTRDTQSGKFARQKTTV